MEKQTQTGSKSGNENPTLDSPGATVADYGNTTGGSANNDLNNEHAHDSGRQGNSSIELDKEDTIGNP